MTELIKALLMNERIVTENTNEARQLYEQSVYGHVLADGRVELSPFEAVYLAEKERVQVLDGKNKLVTTEALLKKTCKKIPEFATKYAVFKDLRSRGYVVKTALKFGADFRVYDRGIKPGEDHARWVVFPVREYDCMTWHEFAAKNRVAHSTKKKLLIAVADDEGDVSYWECGWLRP